MAAVDDALVLELEDALLILALMFLLKFMTLKNLTGGS